MHEKLRKAAFISVQTKTYRCFFKSLFISSTSFLNKSGTDRTKEWGKIYETQLKRKQLIITQIFNGSSVLLGSFLEKTRFFLL